MRVRSGTVRVARSLRSEQLRVCFLALYGRMEHDDPMPPCDGRLVRAHLIPRRLIKKQGGNSQDPRSYVFACGGPMGDSGHHGLLDRARRLRLPREAIPEGTEELASELGLVWWLDREYGERRVTA